MAYGSLALDEISTSGNLAIAGNVITAGDHTANTYRLAPLALGSPITGEFEYDGTVPYFTPADTQRGIVPSMQFYSTIGTTGANSTALQNFLGVGVTLSSNTVYEFAGNFNMFKTAGTVSHSLNFAWGGTSTINRTVTNLLVQNSIQGFITVNTARAVYQYTIEATNFNPTPITSSLGSAFRTINIEFKGIVSVNQGGTFIPQYSLSAAPGGAWTVTRGSNMKIWPIASGSIDTSSISIGTWA